MNSGGPGAICPIDGGDTGDAQRVSSFDRVPDKSFRTEHVTRTCSVRNISDSRTGLASVLATESAVGRAPTRV